MIWGALSECDSDMIHLQLVSVMQKLVGHLET